MLTDFSASPLPTQHLTVVPTPASIGDQKKSAKLTTVLVADSSIELHEHYRGLLAGCLKAPHKVVYARTGREAVVLYENHLPDLVILDVKLAEADVFETACRLWRKNTDAKIVFLAETHREWHFRQIKKLLPEDALFGYLVKGQSDERIGYGIQCVFEHDNSYIDPLTKASRQMRNRGTALTDAEYETLVDMALGLTDRVIAARRNISVRGIQNRINIIFQKLLGEDALRNYDTDGGMINMRVRVVVEAIRRGVIDVEHFGSYEEDLLTFLENRPEKL